MVTITSGRKVTVSAGTAVALVASTQPVSAIVVTAEEDNTGDIVLGDSAIDETPATRAGHLLAAGQSVAINAGENSSGRGMLDIAKLFIDSAVSADGVHWIAMSGNA